MARHSEPRTAPKQSVIRGHAVAAIGELVGTFLFLFAAFLGHTMSVEQAPSLGPNNGPSNQTILSIALSYGFSLLVTAWALYRVSGGLFNPAVTLGMVASGTLPLWPGLWLLPAQLLGGICAAAVASAIVPGDITVVRRSLAPGMSVARGIFLEMVRLRRFLLAMGV